MTTLHLDGSPDSYRGKRLDYLARRPDCSAEKLTRIIKAAIGDGVNEKEIVVAMNDLRYPGYLKDRKRSLANAVAMMKWKYLTVWISLGFQDSQTKSFRSSAIFARAR